MDLALEQGEVEKRIQAVQEEVKKQDEAVKELQKKLKVWLDVVILGTSLNLKYGGPILKEYPDI